MVSSNFRAEKDKKSSSVLVEAAFSLWIVAAQVWYYIQFRDLFQKTVVPMVRRLWH